MTRVFAYLVADRNGRKMRGEIQATDHLRATEQLRQRGDTVIEIQPVESLRRSLRLEVRAKLSDAQLADFALELRGLMLTGTPLPRALATLAEGVSTSSATSLARDLRLQLELGNNASDALARARTYGLRLFGRFLAAAESGGRYDTMLMIASEFLARRSAALQRIRSALAYPIFLLIASGAALAFLIVNVAPTLSTLFEGGDMPPFIAVTSTIGLWVQENARLSLLLIAVLTGAIFFGVQRREVRAAIWKSIAWIPPIRRVGLGLSFGPALMAYSALIRTGWPAERALRLTAEISDGVAQRVFKSIAQRLRDGTTLGSAFKEETALPREVVHAIEIGEATGASSDALDRVSEHLVARSLRTLDRVSAILGPLLIAIIGGLVAFIMINLLSSIGSLGDVAK